MAVGSAGVACVAIGVGLLGTSPYSRPSYSTDFTKADDARWTPNWLGRPGEVTHPPNPTYELQALDPARVAYSADGLELSIRKDPITIQGISYQYRAGMITGYQKQGYVFGRFSARIDVPCDDHKIVNWPAFWLIGDPFRWPATGEIDVFEGLDGHAWWNFHYQDARGNPGSHFRRAPGRYCGWHEFAVGWHAHAIRWFYDGVQVGRVTRHVTHSPMFPVLSYSVTNPHSARCIRYQEACGGKIDADAIMRVRAFTARPLKR